MAKKQEWEIEVEDTETGERLVCRWLFDIGTPDLEVLSTVREIAKVWYRRRIPTIVLGLRRGRIRDGNFA